MPIPAALAQPAAWGDGQTLSCRGQVFRAFMQHIGQHHCDRPGSSSSAAFFRKAVGVYAAVRLGAPLMHFAVPGGTWRSVLSASSPTEMSSPTIWPDSTSPVRGARSFSSGTKRIEAHRTDPELQKRRRAARAEVNAVHALCKRSIIRYRKGGDPKPYAYAIKLRTPTVTLVTVPLSEAEIYCCDGK